MYEQHFGLKKRPFRANAIGTDVFVGPQIAAAMAGLKRAMTASDTIVTVSGPVGSGKTTLVIRALESIGDDRKIIFIARMRLDSDNVLELLLDELGVQDIPKGVIQKFVLFRRRLRELEESGTRVLIAIEDGVRLGADTLAEVEALTGADVGESEGAGVVLMGDDSLDAVLGEAPLARLQQRIRQRLDIAALPAAELRGYLRHCFRLAGGDFEQVFEANAVDVLHHLSNGIPRIANNLVESSMTAAADQDLNQVTTALLLRIAENEYGLSTAGIDLAPKVAPEPALEPALPELVVAAPVIAFAEPDEDAAQETRIEANTPELIQDTLPDLASLAPDLAIVADIPELEPELAPEPDTECEPTPPSVDSSGADVPDWDRDPTTAQLMPDLAALEQAMALAQVDKSAPVAEESAPLPTPEPEAVEEIPEITLDNAINQRIESKLIDEPGEVSAPDVDKKPGLASDSDMPALSLPPKQDKKADAEIEKIAAELAKAKSLEDVDDRMAETLFGDEINFIAAKILANPPSDEPANDELEAVVAIEQTAAAANPIAEEKITSEAPRKLNDGGMKLSASQRLRTVRALNAKPEPVAEIQPAVIVDTTPEPIEDQINTSITQTLKALNVTLPVLDSDAEDEDEDEENKGGFFSRFKRS